MFSMLYCVNKDINEQLMASLVVSVLHFLLSVNFLTFLCPELIWFHTRTVTLSVLLGFV